MLKYVSNTSAKILSNWFNSEKYKLLAISIKHFIMFLKFTKKLNYIKGFVELEILIPFLTSFNTHKGGWYLE